MDLGGGAIELPPGFRFHPTDEELVNYYLCRKCGGLPIAAPVITEVDLYKFEPWKLPEKAVGGQDSKEWYFFSPRDRKYPNGSRPNRAAGTGYWKATGADKPVGSPRPMAIKKALVFYAGKPPKGVKTNWIMHEYRLADVDRSAAARKKTNNALRFASDMRKAIAAVSHVVMAHALRDRDNGASLIARQSGVHVEHLDDWVLCRIYNKKGVIERYDTVDSGADEAKPAAAPPARNPRSGQYPVVPAMKIELSDYGFYQHPSPPATEMLCFGRSGSADRDSDPRSLPLLHTDSSSSDRAQHSPSPDLSNDMDYAESPHPAAGCGGGGWPGDDWGCGIEDNGFVIDQSVIFDPLSPGDFCFDRDAAAFGDMLSYLQKPF